MDEQPNLIQEEQIEKRSNNSKLGLLGLVKLSSLFAFLTTYTHFFGFSFLKGQVQGMGFHSSSINPTVNETLYLAAEGVREALKRFSLALFESETFLTNASLSAIALISVALLHLYKEQLKTWTRTTLGPKVSKSTTSNWARVPITILVAGVFGVAIQVLFPLFLIIVIGFLWMGLTLGQDLGQKYIGDMLVSGVCEKVDWDKQKKDFAIGCTVISGELESEFGRLVQQDSTQTYFVTNTAAYRLDPKGNVLEKVVILKRPAGSEL